jgi:hypothetical protein
MASHEILLIPGFQCVKWVKNRFSDLYETWANALRAPVPERADAYLAAIAIGYFLRSQIDPISHVSPAGKRRDQ